MSLAARDQERPVSATSRAKVNVHARRRQNLLLVACLAIIGAVAIAIVLLARPRPKADNFATTPRLSLPGTAADASELWRDSAERDLATLREDHDALRVSLDLAHSRLDAVSGELAAARATAAELDFEREILALASTMEPPTELVVPPDHATVQAVPPSAPPRPPAIRLARVGTAADGTVLPALDSLGAAAGDRLGDIEDARRETIVQRPQTASVAVAAPAAYLPSGSFMPAVILGGLDAPTGVVSRDNPHPVLMRIHAAARLPNLGRRDLRECFVLAAGYGDIASERALLRTERLSCERTDGTYLDTELRGFVVGEDGRAGVRGRLVTKQGQILQRSLAAGIGAGFSEMFANRRAQQLTSLSTVALSAGTFGDYAVAGLGSGLGSSLDRLANYYIALADRVHPVIEVGAGRTVDIVVQHGLDLGQ